MIIAEIILILYIARQIDDLIWGSGWGSRER